MSAAIASPEDLPADQGRSDAQRARDGGDLISEQARKRAAANGISPARSNVPADHHGCVHPTGSVGGDLSSSGPTGTDTHRGRAAAPTSPDPAMDGSSPKAATPGPGADDPRGSATLGASSMDASPGLADPLFPAGQASAALLSPDPTTAMSVSSTDTSGPGTTAAPEQAISEPTPRTGPPARVPFPPAPAMIVAAPKPAAPVLAEPDSPRDPARMRSSPTAGMLGLADPLLALAADVLDDTEKVLNANRNRTRLLTKPTDVPDEDGQCRGLGFPPDHPYVALITASVDAFAAAEEQATKHLERMFRPHPLWSWQQRQRGIGEKQLARLLAVIGDPYWHGTDDHPRTVSQLWAYCGYRPGQRRRKGEKSKWSTKAKSRAYLIAEKCMMQLVKPCARPDGQAWAVHVDGCQCSPYRLVYDRVREQKAGSLHHEDCAQCGPRGKPALAGSPRSEKHLKVMALRVAAKAVLRDVWREAKRIHEEHSDLK